MTRAVMTSVDDISSSDESGDDEKYLRVLSYSSILLNFISYPFNVITDNVSQHFFFQLECSILLFALPRPHPIRSMGTNLSHRYGWVTFG
jgi:hypothetical protein